MKISELISKYSEKRLKASEERAKARRLWRETEDEELKESYKLDMDSLGDEASHISVFLEDLRKLDRNGE